MISDYLIPAIKKRFPNQPFDFNKSPELAFAIQSPCNEFGELALSDDGDEVTLFLGNSTHTHIGCYEGNLSQVEQEQRISSEVIAFLEALFDDRVVVWHGIGGIGGCRRLEIGKSPPEPSLIKRQFPWSREIK